MWKEVRPSHCGSGPFIHAFILLSLQLCVVNVIHFYRTEKGCQVICQLAQGKPGLRARALRSPAAPAPEPWPSMGPSSLLTESPSTLEGNMLELVPRVGPSCHCPSCCDPGVRHPMPACKLRPGRHTQLLTHRSWEGRPRDQTGATALSVFYPGL